MMMMMMTQRFSINYKRGGGGGGYSKFKPNSHHQYCDSGVLSQEIFC